MKTCQHSFFAWATYTDAGFGWIGVQTCIDCGAAMQTLGYSSQQVLARQR